MKSGFVALIGRPNSGKSTLLNALIEQKIAIISPKAQTTRNQIRGIRTDEDSQIIFIDTPGIHKPQHMLGSQMNKQAFTALAGVDVIYYLVDASVPYGSGEEFVLNRVKEENVPVFLILNKVDLLTKDQLMETLLEWNKRHDFKEIVPISAKEENNLDELIATTKLYLEDGVKYYPDDMVCDYPEQFIIAETIREKVLLLTEEEVPHSVAVTIEKMGRKKGALLIHATILVERDSQKGILIGKQGQMIKKIGTMAREELQGVFGDRLYLELFVRVEKNWRNRQAKLMQLGYIQIDEDIDEEE
ncbi:MAG: GTPase Era [Erysipelotrichaceae bacterium]|nr:GTPase Era [Erysipelotrichaceae bacterium]